VREPSQHLRRSGTAAILAGLLYLPASITGHLFPGDQVPPSHELHWVSHAVTGVVSALILASLPGIYSRWHADAGARRIIGTIAILVVAVGAALDVTQGFLIALSEPLGGGESSQLWNVGHILAMGSLLFLPGAFLLGLASWRRRLLSRAGTVSMVVSIPIAAVLGPLLDAAGFPGGDAVLAIFAGIGAAWVLWGLDLRQGATTVWQSPRDI